MPTYDTLAAFDRDYGRLSPAQRVLVRAAVVAFVADLKTGTFRAGLRVKRVAGRHGVWEMTWDDDGRATFHYGPEQRSNEPHVVWRRIGSHDIFRNP